MRVLTLVAALIVSLAPVVRGQGSRISGPINKARSAAAAASARTERQQREGLAPQNVDSTAKPGAATKSAGQTSAPPANPSAQTANSAPVQATRPNQGIAPAPGSAVPRQTTASTASGGKAPAGTPPTGAVPPPAGGKSPPATKTVGTVPPPPAGAAGGAGAPRAVTTGAVRPSNTVESARDTSRMPAPAAQPRPDVSISREVFAYDPAGRRDPFVSLLTTDDLRPLLTDLVLVGIALDRNPRNSVAIMRDAKTKEQYRAREGQLVGRMRVSSIDKKQVVFTIEEFGFSRQEMLVLGDTSKVRKQ